MFPLGRLPMIEHTIIELKRSGIKRICVVIRKGKEVIEEYLKGRKYKEIEIILCLPEEAPWHRRCTSKGKGFCRKKLLLSWPFQTRCFYSKKPATRQLLEQKEGTGGIWNSMVKDPEKGSPFFHGGSVLQISKGRWKYICP